MALGAHGDWRSAALDTPVGAAALVFGFKVNNLLVQIWSLEIQMYVI